MFAQILFANQFIGPDRLRFQIRVALLALPSIAIVKLVGVRRPEGLAKEEFKVRPVPRVVYQGQARVGGPPEGLVAIETYPGV